MNSQRPLVSIVIPTRNEERDILPTLENCRRLSYSNVELLVVDDSTDNTRAIVASLGWPNLKLIERSVNRNGCCGARNAGIAAAAGEIVVLLNADARPDADFLDRILVHYQQGADYLVVKSRVQNRDNAHGLLKHVECEYFSHDADPSWSEGFSCRRSAALSIGMIPGDYPVPFCRDYMIGTNFKKAGKTKHIDPEIVVNHIWPEDSSAAFGTYAFRGSISAPTSYFLAHRSFVVTAAREAAKTLRACLQVMTVLPCLLKAGRYAERAGRPSEIWRLFGAIVVEQAGTVWGNWRGVFRIYKWLTQQAR